MKSLLKVRSFAIYILLPLCCFVCIYIAASLFIVGTFDVTKWTELDMYYWKRVSILSLLFGFCSGSYTQTK